MYIPGANVALQSSEAVLQNFFFPVPNIMIKLCFATQSYISPTNNWTSTHWLFGTHTMSGLEKRLRKRKTESDRMREKRYWLERVQRREDEDG